MEHTQAIADVVSDAAKAVARPKPEARAWLTSKTAWFVLPRRARSDGVVGIARGDWTTVTRTHDMTRVSEHSRARMRRVIHQMQASRAVSKRQSTRQFKK